MKERIRQNAVPALFFGMCVLGMLISGQNSRYVAQELISRLARNWFLVLSLIIPVTAGLGLNFAIVLGAMAGQIGLIIVTHYKLPGLAGLAVAALLSVPIAVVLGISAGHVLNKARGREMITSMMLGFAVNGFYQLVFLFMVGTVFPVKNPEIMLDNGVGLRGTIELKYCKYALDNLIRLRLFRIAALGRPGAFCAEEAWSLPRFSSVTPLCAMRPNTIPSGWLITQMMQNAFWKTGSILSKDGKIRRSLISGLYTPVKLQILWKRLVLKLRLSWRKKDS